MDAIVSGYGMRCSDRFVMVRLLLRAVVGVLEPRMQLRDGDCQIDHKDSLAAL